MKKWTIGIVCILCMLLVSGLALADEVADKLKKADELFYKVEVEAYKQAGQIYEELYAKYPTNYEVMWKMARFYEKVAPNATDPLAVFEKGKAIAEKTATMYPNKVEGHYWYASLIGRVGEKKGILNSLFMVKPMKEELDRCVAIDPKFPDAYYVLGMLYWKVPGWPLSIGDKKLAVEYAAKSVELKPTSFLFQWSLYEAYEAAGKKTEATAVLEHIIKMPVAPGEEKAAVDYKQRAKDVLK